MFVLRHLVQTYILLSPAVWLQLHLCLVIGVACFNPPDFILSHSSLIFIWFIAFSLILYFSHCPKQDIIFSYTTVLLYFLLFSVVFPLPLFFAYNPSCPLFLFSCFHFLFLFLVSFSLFLFCSLSDFCFFPFTTLLLSLSPMLTSAWSFPFFLSSSFLYSSIHLSSISS